VAPALPKGTRPGGWGALGRVSAPRYGAAMSEDERSKSKEPTESDAVEAVDEESEAPSTPFDSPWFLPVLLWPLSAWFGYDGWFNPEMEEHLLFNRAGFGVLVLAAIWYTFQAVRETKQDSGESHGREGGPG
jgi:hypothetical protein